MIAGVALVLLGGGFASGYLTYRARYLRRVRQPHPELAEIQARYGPAHYSNGPEEWLIRDYFNDRRGGVFVDVGANDYKVASNTYYLEIALGWSGLAIEPQVKFAADYGKYRPRTRFIPLFVSSESNADVVLYVPKLDQRASQDRSFAGGPAVPMHARTTTLDDVLSRTGVTHIDLLSIDVELAEPQVLAGFTISRYRPALVCIEAHPRVRQQILDYFAKNGYGIVGRYLRVDQNNLWFAPPGP